MKESAEVTIDILESENNIDTSLKQILRFRYLQLAILCWNIDPKDETSINNYLNKAAISDDLFVNKYIQRLFFAFINQTYLNYNSMDLKKVKLLERNIIVFFATHIKNRSSSKSKKFAAMLISQCYLMLSVRQKNIFLFLKGFSVSPLYLLQFILINIP